MGEQSEAVSPPDDPKVRAEAEPLLRASLEAVSARGPMHSHEAGPPRPWRR